MPVVDLEITLLLWGWISQYPKHSNVLNGRIDDEPGRAVDFERARGSAPAMLIDPEREVVADWSRLEFSGGLARVGAGLLNCPPRGGAQPVKGIAGAGWTSRPL